MKRRKQLRARPRLVHLAILLPESDEPPTEFRVFRAGSNESRKGTVLFDAVAAEAVMAAHRAHGADVMIDLEHLALEPYSPNFDPDARGWAQLELRDGELWAVNVKWTDDGAARLRQRRQRYISPAFLVDAKSNRVTELINVAITALPATDQLDALIAARAEQETATMLEKILAALGLPADATEESILKRLAELVPPKDEEEEEEAAKVTPSAASAAAELTAEVAVLRSAFARLRDERDAIEVREILRANAHRALTPALEKVLLTKRPEEVREIVEALPERRRAEAREPQQRHETVTLTDSDRRLCRLLGTPEEKFLEHKKVLAQRAADRAAEVM